MSAGYSPCAITPAYFGGLFMRMYDIIQKKRDGGVLTDEEIDFFVKGYVANEIPDYQASALMMAIFFKGMNDEETALLTRFMAHSGDTVDLSRFGTLSVDKHSTGGVGDKTTLIVAPIVASVGCKVAKMSGRGLGHTGGTVDKLESIPGYNTSLEVGAFLKQVEKTGVAVIGQTGNLAPADKKMYALRDVTATVDSIPLITSSIMSKKLAAGSHSIVLDVKVGSGAFMKTVDDAQALAEKMVDIGKRCGRKMTAVLTDMNTPLGHNVGNALEIIEAVNILKGEKTGDLREVCLTLAANMISLSLGISVEDAQKKAEDAISSGAAFEKMKEWVRAQGGDASYLDDTSKFPTPSFSRLVKAPADGFIFSTDAEKIGIAAVELGAGRAAKTDSIDHAAGIVIAKKAGECVKKGDELCVLFTNNSNSLDEAEKKYLDAIEISDKKPAARPLIYGIVR